MAFNRPLMISGVKDLKLNYDNEGVQAFWKDILKALDKRPMGAILIRQIAEDTAGLYDQELNTDCITFNANQAFYNEKSKYLTLTEDGALTLLHEGSHFMHLGVDEGRYIAPCYKGCANARLDNTIENFNDKTQRKNRYMLEFEAGYRAVCAAIMYDTNMETRVMGDNLRNLLCYANDSQPWMQMLGKLLHIPDVSFTIYNTVQDTMLSICEHAMDGHSFMDVEDINSFKIDLTPKQTMLISMLVKLCKDVYPMAEL